MPGRESMGAVEVGDGSIVTAAIDEETERFILRLRSVIHDLRLAIENREGWTPGCQELWDLVRMDDHWTKDGWKERVMDAPTELGGPDFSNIPTCGGCGQPLTALAELVQLVITNDRLMSAES